MLTAIIRFSLLNRLTVLALAVFLLLLGGWQAVKLPIDVFPDLDRPRVVVMTEAPGMAPEEVESLITFPLETAIQGATGVGAVRSSSGIGLSVIYVEFDWGTDIYDDRQIVAERLAQAADKLPPGHQPQLMPIASIMGQIMIAGMVADGPTTPIQLRTIADWYVRPRLLTVPGVAQVIVMGGSRKQYQVLVDPERLLRFGVTLHEVKVALDESNQNTTGGYLDEQGPREYLVRSLGRVTSTDELAEVVVAQRDGQTISLAQVARVVEGPQVKRGDSAAFQRGSNGEMIGGAAVVLTILKQPHADTRLVTERVSNTLATINSGLPAGVRILSDLYQQRAFIDRAIENVANALRDGVALVVVVLVLFLMNLRTTLITLTAIPLSIAITAIVFTSLDLSINTMTLGGLSVAIGELVDDAIVDVENIFRRLRENRQADQPRHPLLVVFQASCEIRNSIVYGTFIVVLVFIPLFALSGMAGRLFTPLGIAYIVSITSSLLVSLTVTPVLSYLLLAHAPQPLTRPEGWVLRFLKRIAELVIRASLRLAWPVLAVTLVAVGLAVGALLSLESDFLPPFNEGTVQINALLPPGTSLATSNQIARRVEERLGQLPDLVAFVRRTGRAELDEHAEGVHVSEFIATIDPASRRSRAELIDEIRQAVREIPGVAATVEQPLAHLVSHMLSGVKAQIAIKIFGDDLEELRRLAQNTAAAINDVPGIRNLMVEQQVTIPQLRIEADGRKLQAFGIRRSHINEFVQTAMQGQVVSQIYDGQKRFDLIVRLTEAAREDLDALRRLQIELPSGGSVKLEDVANIYRAGGPNTVQREQARRRIVVQCDVAERGLVDVVDDIQERLSPVLSELPAGYFVELGGQFKSQQQAARRIALLFCLSLAAIFVVLYKMFGSTNLSLQVMVALPTAFIGSVAALVITGQTFTIASMVGFISLSGIATRNGILLINHYLHLVRFEGESWTRDMVVRAGKDRMAPVLMTALTTGLGLTPLALAAGEAGKEILYPVATVILGGLITSTLLEFLVRPALFWKLGLEAANRVVKTGRADVRLVEQGRS